ncbi:glycosyltransferase family 2 protein [Agaribacter flavus]|uniref:Glycosyltransferase family 2 protein n=1 Tax=Agaribacter flavus TaxID=1902781 RepID=A0ABV7FMC3_9ALTE
MNKPKVSVILPIYNVEKYLAQCLSSLTKQSYSNYELIAINDGSTDTSLEIVESYKEHFGSKLIIINQDNSGLSAARNAGLNNATGKYIYFLDSDDWILPTTLEKCVSSLEESGADLLLFNGSAFCDGMSGETIREYDYSRNMPKAKYTNGLEAFSDSLFKGTYVCQSCCYMYRFSTYHELRFIDGILHEDNHFTTLLVVLSKHTEVIQDRFFQRRIRQNSITTSAKTPPHADGYYITVDVLHKYLTNENLMSEALVEYLNRLLRKGFSVEKNIHPNRNTLSYKLKLASRFENVITYKSKIHLFCSPMFTLLVKIKHLLKR